MQQPQTSCFYRDFALLHGKCGHGGQAEVFRCRERKTNRTFALKVRADTASARAEMQMMATAQVAAPFGVALLRAVYANETSFGRRFPDPKPLLFLVIELAQGGDLMDYILRLHKQGQRMSEFQVRLVLRQLARTLATLHAAGIAHLDIKPENILLRQDDGGMDCMLADFGFATTEVQPSSPMFTPAYCPPDLIHQTTSGIKAFSAECDMWSLGVTVYILLTSTFPFHSESKHLTPQLQKDIVECNVLPCAAWDALSPEARRVVQRLMCINPLSRMTASELRDDPWLALSSSPAIFAAA